MNKHKLNENKRFSEVGFWRRFLRAKGIDNIERNRKIGQKKAVVTGLVSHKNDNGSLLERVWRVTKSIVFIKKKNVQI